MFESRPDRNIPPIDFQAPEPLSRFYHLKKRPRSIGCDLRLLCDCRQAALVHRLTSQHQCHCSDLATAWPAWRSRFYRCRQTSSQKYCLVDCDTEFEFFRSDKPESSAE